jgi:hypothetical protein
MQVQMVNALAGILSGVRHNPVAITVETLLGCHLSGKGQEATE